MLTIQPAQSKVAFEAKRPLTEEEIVAIKEEREYQKQYDEMLEQRDEFKKLADKKDDVMPDAAKKIFKGGAVVTTGILGGMAAGWGTGKSIKGLEKLGDTKFVKDAKTQLKATNEFVSKTAKNIKTDFINSEAYKLHNLKLEKARQSKFWGPVLKFFGAIGKGIKFVYTKIKNGINYIINKIKSVKAETWKKATVNTVGISGGIASGVTAAKESVEE